MTALDRDQLSVLTALARQTYTADGRWARAELARHGLDRFGKPPAADQAAAPDAPPTPPDWA